MLKQSIDTKGGGEIMATTTRIPVEQYLTGQYESDVDYVDGIIEERNLGENDHSKWQLAI